MTLKRRIEAAEREVAERAQQPKTSNLLGGVAEVMADWPFEFLTGEGSREQCAAIAARIRAGEFDTLEQAFDQLSDSMLDVWDDLLDARDKCDCPMQRECGVCFRDLAAKIHGHPTRAEEIYQLTEDGDGDSVPFLQCDALAATDDHDYIEACRVNAIREDTPESADDCRRLVEKNRAARVERRDTAFRARASVPLSEVTDCPSRQLRLP